MFLLRLLLLSSLFLGMACRQPAFDARLKARVLAGLDERIASVAYADGTDFSRWPEYKARHGKALAEAQAVESFAAAANRALDEFRISHLRLRTPEEAKARRAHEAMASLGLQAQRQETVWVVFEVDEGGPADRAGIRRGDLLDLPPGADLGTAFGPRKIGAKVHLAWLRDGVRFVSDLTREVVVRREPASLRWLSPGVALLRIPSFRDGRYDRTRVERLLAEAREAHSLVLDLRNNGGGLLNHVGHLLGQLLPEGTPLYAVVDKAAAREGGSLGAVDLARTHSRYRAAKAAEGGPFRGRLAVLVSPLNGSGGELVPAILQDHRRAVVIGTKTMGAVLGARDFGLPGGWEVQVPLLEVVTAGGRTLEHKGVAPDVLLPGADLARDDRAMAAAQKALMEAKLAPAA